LAAFFIGGKSMTINFIGPQNDLLDPRHRLAHLRLLERIATFDASIRESERLVAQLGGHLPEYSKQVNRLAWLLHEADRSAQHVFSKVREVRP
jgi:hypothetical protein